MDKYDYIKQELKEVFGFRLRMQEETGMLRIIVGTGLSDYEVYAGGYCWIVRREVMDRNEGNITSVYTEFEQQEQVIDYLVTHISHLSINGETQEEYITDWR